jgi:hypothetical protein
LTKHSDEFRRRKGGQPIGSGAQPQAVSVDTLLPSDTKMEVALTGAPMNFFPSVNYVTSLDRLLHYFTELGERIAQREMSDQRRRAKTAL